MVYLTSRLATTRLLPLASWPKPGHYTQPGILNSTSNTHTHTQTHTPTLTTTSHHSGVRIYSYYLWFLDLIWTSSSLIVYSINCISSPLYILQLKVYHFKLLSRYYPQLLSSGPSSKTQSSVFSEPKPRVLDTIKEKSPYHSDYPSTLTGLLMQCFCLSTQKAFQTSATRACSSSFSTNDLTYCFKEHKPLNNPSTSSHKTLNVSIPVLIL